MATSLRRCVPSIFRRSLHTSSPKLQDLAGLSVSRRRLMESIHQTCKWGTGHRYGSLETETGMTRLALSDSDKEVRDWFVNTTRDLGCTTTVDQMGNIFAIRPGKRGSLSLKAAPTVAGSHLDTQPTGGRYDGILGVLAGVEMLRVLKDANYETEGPVGVVNWTNEEGARFPMSMVSSGVWAGRIPLQTAWDLKALDGPVTMKAELERIGYLGSADASYEATPLGAHFELHIEQGPILEAEGKRVGVVLGGQAYKWFRVRVEGREAHTGSTPLHTRSDAMLAAARMIAESNSIAQEAGGLASTGVLKLTPGSTNTIPGRVEFSLDIRHPSDSSLAIMEQACRQAFERIAKDEHHSRGCTVSFELDTDSAAVEFNEDCIKMVREAAVDTVSADLVRDIYSGAGHDSCFTSKRCPTTMIFVPCLEGISHNPKEFCKEEDCEVGAQVLMQSVLRYDRFRAERGDFD